MFEAHQSELAHVRKHKRALLLIEHEVIIFARRQIGRRGQKLPGHAEVNAQPQMPRKSKQHLFAAGFRFEQGRARKFRRQGAGIGDSAVPLSAVKLHFGQFGHTLIAAIRTMD